MGTFKQARTHYPFLKRGLNELSCILKERLGKLHALTAKPLSVVLLFFTFLLSVRTVAQCPPPTVSVTHATCTTPTGCLTVTSPVGDEFSYSINGQQFQTSPQFCGLDPGIYCIKVTNGSCVSDTTCKKIETPEKPPAPTVTITNPTCTTPTGCLTVTSPVGDDFSYSINGQPFQTSPQFCGLDPGIYCIKFKNGDCVSDTICKKIEALENFPAPTVTITHANCITPTGCLTVISPVGDDFSYSINGGPFQTSPQFCGLDPGTYCIRVKNSDQCFSDTTCKTIKEPPANPPAPTVTITQPTCTPATGCLTVTSPVGEGFTYSINGGLFQTNPQFCNLDPGIYCIRVKNIDGCVSDTTCKTINTPTKVPKCKMEGCTPGFWKNATTYWDQATDMRSACIAGALPGPYDGTGTTNDLFRTTFGLTSAQMTAAGLNPNLTLLEALKTGGGGCFKLLSHSVAALLNSCGLKSYRYATTQVLTMTHDAIANKACDLTANKFVAANEAGNCPLKGDRNNALISQSSAEAPDNIVKSDKELIMVYPNPYLNQIHFSIKSPVSGKVTLEVYNVLGQKLATIYDGKVNAGIEQRFTYNVPAVNRVTMMYMLTIGKKTYRSTVIPIK